MIMKEQVKKLVDQVYELEGLLLLDLHRENVTENISGLIRDKSGFISETIDALYPESFGEQETDEEPEAIAEPETVAEPEPLAEPELISEPEPITEQEPDEEEVTEIYEESHEDEQDEDTFYNLEEEDDRPVTPAPSFRPANRKPAPKFSINDKFLYIRELFNGSAVTFYDAIDRLPSFSDADEAQNYFIERLSLNPDDETSARFLEMVKSYY